MAVPLVGFILLGVWLHNGRGWGGWTVPVGVLLGLLGAVGGFISSLRTMHRLQKQNEKRGRTQGFNHHD